MITVGYGVTANIAASHARSRQLGVRFPVSEFFSLSTYIHPFIPSLVHSSVRGIAHLRLYSFDEAQSRNSNRRGFCTNPRIVPSYPTSRDVISRATREPLFTFSFLLRLDFVRAPKKTVHHVIRISAEPLRCIRKPGATPRHRRNWRTRVVVAALREACATPQPAFLPPTLQSPWLSFERLVSSSFSTPS